MSENHSWKDLLQNKMPQDWAKEVDEFEANIVLNKQGKIEPRIFAETRLRRGAYGQRYDNGKRNDGKQIRKLKYPNEGMWKGPDTHWDAPGMQRIKFPWGGITADQLEAMADLAEEYSRRYRPHHHPAGFSASLYPCGRHAQHHAPSGRGGHYHPRSLRQLGP